MQHLLSRIVSTSLADMESLTEAQEFLFFVITSGKRPDI